LSHPVREADVEKSYRVNVSPGTQNTMDEIAWGGGSKTNVPPSPLFPLA